MTENSDSNEIAKNVCGSLQNLLKDNLVSCILYGSVVRGNAIPGKSDINLLIVLEHSTPEAHRAIAEELKKYPLIAPFILSRRELVRSRPVFALKFSSIKRHYKVLYGEDILSDFTPSADLLKFLCEQSLRNLRLKLKHSYIRTIDKPDQYRNVIIQFIPSIFVTLSEVLRCWDITVPAEYNTRPKIIGEAIQHDPAILEELLHLRSEPRKFSSEDAFKFHSEIFRILSSTLTKVKEKWPQAIDLQ